MIGNSKGNVADVPQVFLFARAKAFDSNFYVRRSSAASTSVSITPQDGQRIKPIDEGAKEEAAEYRYAGLS